VPGYGQFSAQQTGAHEEGVPLYMMENSGPFRVLVLLKRLVEVEF
jgi:hypothetical protein